MDGGYYVYIMTNRNNTVLYTGLTNDLERRVIEPRNGTAGSFTAKYKIVKLVYYCEYHEINDAIDEEKRIKAGSRQKKIDLIQSINPKWKELLPFGQ